MPDALSPNLLELTTLVTANYVANNPVAIGELPNLIKLVSDALRGLDVEIEEPAKLVPAVPIKKSIQPSFLVCLEDGKKMKTLKRYLRSRFDLTPDEYRARWGLAPDYPMSAPALSAARSQIAKQIGLGAKPKRRKRGPGRPKKV